MCSVPKPTSGFFAATKVGCRGDVIKRGPSSVALSLFGGIVDMLVTCDRLFRLAARLGGLRRLTQSYVGKRLVWKRMSRAIQRFRVFFRTPSEQYRRMASRSADRDHPSRRHCNELLIFFQSALIQIAETWDVLRKDSWTAQGLPETSRAVLPAALRWDC
jgi:hypothetical protein